MNETLFRLGAQFVGVALVVQLFGGLSLLGAKFARGRICKGWSLSGAEMSQNHLYHIIVSLFPKEVFLEYL